MPRNRLVVVLVLTAVLTGAGATRASFAADTQEMPSHTAVIPTEANRHVEQANQLEEHDEPVWIGEGESRFLAIRRTSTVPVTAGTFVLVRNRAAGSDAADRLGYLRKNLPHLGWDTLVLELPDPPVVNVPVRERERTDPVAPGLRNGRTEVEALAAPPAAAPSASATASSAAATGPSAAATQAGAKPAVSDTAAHADRDRIVARLSAAAIEAARVAGPVVMIGEGEAAAWVARVNGATPVATAVIALNIDDPGARVDGEPVSHWVGALGVPSLVLQEAPRVWSEDDRLRASTELRLLPASHPSGEERLVRLVRGWLGRRQPG